MICAPEEVYKQKMQQEVKKNDVHLCNRISN